MYKGISISPNLWFFWGRLPEIGNDIKQDPFLLALPPSWKRSLFTAISALCHNHFAKDWILPPPCCLLQRAILLGKWPLLTFSDGCVGAVIWFGRAVAGWHGKWKVSPITAGCGCRLHAFVGKWRRMACLSLLPSHLLTFWCAIALQSWDTVARLAAAAAPTPPTHTHHTFSSHN